MHWEVLEDETLTEHQYIYFEIGKAGTGKRTVFTKPAVDWKAFRETLEITTTGMAAANYVTGTRLIMQAFRNSIQRNTKCKQDPYWWTDDIGEKRRACMKTRRELTRIRKTTGMAAANYVTGTRLIMQAFRNSIQRNTKCKQDPYWWTDDIGEKRRACMKTRRELTRIRKRNVDAPAWDAALMAYRSSRKAHQAV
ncbi:hypothetical protein QE152_g15958 [Popillia japonica]|uniref:Uncharacterized protein n=1 Tax=Popillia japonica TaxID=7064 RepID=A0AAW1L6K3_POPJA